MTETTYLFTFERLDIWKMSKTLVKDMYLLTNALPEKENFGLISQLRRAAISVSSNIAEGSARFSKKDQAYFMERAYGSLMEIICQLLICSELGYIPSTEITGKRSFFHALSNKVNAFRKHLLKGTINSCNSGNSPIHH